jgi:hypothetical protein
LAKNESLGGKYFVLDYSVLVYEYRTRLEARVILIGSCLVANVMCAHQRAMFSKISKIFFFQTSFSFPNSECLLKRKESIPLLERDLILSISSIRIMSQSISLQSWDYATAAPKRFDTTHSANAMPPPPKKRTAPNCGICGRKDVQFPAYFIANVSLLIEFQDAFLD